MDATALLGLLTIIEGKSFICKCSSQWGQNILSLGPYLVFIATNFVMGPFILIYPRKVVFFPLIVAILFYSFQENFYISH